LLIGTIAGSKRLFFECVLKRGRFLVFVEGAEKGNCLLSTSTLGIIKISRGGLLKDKSVML
jgi:hypothetical protein